VASKGKRVGRIPRSTPGETTPTGLTASGSRAPQSGPTSTTRRLRAPSTSDSEHKDSGSGNSEYEDPEMFRETETRQRVENNPSEPEPIEIDPPAPEPPKITYFPASYLQRTRSTAHSSTSTPTHTNHPPPSVTAMATTSKELTGISRPDPFKGDPSDLDRFFNDCHLFLDANSDIYNNEKKKVIFTLSYLKGGNAERYKTL